MPKYEIHYRIEEDGRISIEADSEEQAREKFDELSLGDIRYQGLVDYDEAKIRAIDKEND